VADDLHPEPMIGHTEPMIGRTEPMTGHTEPNTGQPAPTTGQPAPRWPVSGTDAPHIAMPLGGIGTGNLAICSDGGLRQWQLHNIGNHSGALPGSFLAIRATHWEPPLDTVRILQAPAPPTTETPLVTDDVLPTWQRRLLAEHPGVQRVEFGGCYPFAQLRYHDDALPVEVTLEAFNPLIPLNVPDSSLPVAMFTIRLHNPGTLPVHGSVGAALQNAVGWDGVSPIDMVTGAGYGGNANRVRRADGWTTVLLENPALAPDAPGAGQMLLAADHPAAPVLRQWRHPGEFVTFLRSRAPADGAFRLVQAPGTPDPQRHGPAGYLGASPPGQTWNTGIAVPFALQPGQHTEIRLLMSWHFPNRTVNFEQFGPPRPEWGATRFWLGNHYTTVHPDAESVARAVIPRWHELREASRAWTDTLAGSGLDEQAVRHLAAQLSLIRSPTCFRTADGRFFGFEGTLGASTGMWSGEYGGSCPLNCTHVWNYEQALAAAFPELERSMRETEFDIAQAPEGYLPHRVIAPVYLRQLWDEPIGGPEDPALDGMLGAVLKTYREVRHGAGMHWLRRYWPNVVRLLEHVQRTWDRDRAGLLRGIQPSTHDIDLAGLNTYMGTLYLAALRAAEEMALLLDDPGAAAGYREVFGRGSAGYDEALFTGEYYRQVLDPGDPVAFQWLDGCLSDQLIGQWWAHQLGLGHLLPADHVRTALRSVVRHNLRSDFTDFRHPYRVFADGEDTGLLMCSWPHGGRPEIPTRYADEVWTGIEYQVAAHCLQEGLQEEAWQILRGVWGRYDGRRRNPYNEIECGDHDARAMAGRSVLEALSGVSWNAATGAVRMCLPEGDAATPVLAGGGWGTLGTSGGEVRLECRFGRWEIAELTLTGLSCQTADVHLELAAGGSVAPVDCSVATGPDGAVTVIPATPVRITPGGALTLRSRR
jgi:uncharacterized protein (DUF608 family)